jgi:fatty-acid peroxygenase
MTDLAIRFLRDGYGAVELDRRSRDGRHSYVSRLLGRRALVVCGESGARLFYDEDVVKRGGAVPPALAWLLFGRGAVHGLDEKPHRRRKQLFLDHLRPDQVQTCAELAGANLRDLVTDSLGREVGLFSELVSVYGRAAIAWAGIDCTRDEAERLSRQFAAIVDGFGFSGAAYVRAWRARLRMNAWGRRLVEDVRRGRVAARDGSVLQALAATDLDPHAASVELGNVLRPTVAVAWLGTFAALALDALPEWRPRLAEPDAAAERLAFAQEVRRTTPFAPALAARVRLDASHGDLALRRGDRLVLDVRGTNLDARLHPDPHVFRPERFLEHPPGPFELVPQGGGAPTGHRCPGESMTLQLLAETLQVLAGVDFRVVSGREADLTRIPTLPPEGLRIHLG